MNASTFVFAHALVAVAGAAALWIIWQRLTQELALLRYTTERECAKLSDSAARHTTELQSLKRSAPADLADRVDELSAAVEKLRETQRRFAGRFDARMAKLDDAATSNETPEQARERLRRTHGLPKIGGNGA